MVLTDHLLINENQISSFKKGDEHAFSLIYNLYWERLLEIAFRHLQDKFSAEEVVQEVFISLWQRRATIEIHNLEAYLATAVKFSTFKAIQRNKRKAEIQDRVAPPDYYAEEQNIDARFLQDFLDNVVEQMPEKCKLVFKMSRDAYFTNPEISKKLNISEKTVEAHITRALKILRVNLHKVGLGISFLFTFFN